MKLTADRPFADAEKAARRLLEHAHVFKPIQDGRIYIEKLDGPFLFRDKGTPAEYSAGPKLAIERGWLEIHLLSSRLPAPICSPESIDRNLRRGERLKSCARSPTGAINGRLQLLPLRLGPS